MLYNNEIEKSVLGCLLMDNALIQKIKPEVKAEYFNNPLYRKLYEEIVDLHERKQIADITVIKTVDVETAIDIANFVPTISNFNRYKKELIDLGVKRELVKACENIKNRIIDSDDSAEVIKTESLNLINEIKIQDIQEENTSITDVLLQSIETLEKRQNEKESTYKKWGIKWLDEKTGGIRPELTYLAARPSVGKSAFALQIGKYVAKQGKKVAIFSLEMSKVNIVNRLICNAGGISKDLFDKNVKMTTEQWKDISKVSAELSTLPIDIYDKAFTIEEILLNAEEQRTKKGLDFLILDYVQLCESRQKFNSTNDRISYISRQLKKYQQRTGIHVLALSQFNRESEAKKFPTLANLRDSGSLEQDGNNVFFLHEEYVDPEIAETREHKEVLLIIAKQREGERNICSKLKFYGGTQRFYDN